MSSVPRSRLLSSSSVDGELSPSQYTSILSDMQADVEILLARKNPSALPLLEMTTNLIRTHLSYMNSGIDLPDKYEDQVSTVRMVIQSQLSRTLDEDEKADTSMLLDVLFYNKEGNVQEIALRGIQPSFTLGQVREEVATSVNIDKLDVLLKYKGEILPASKDTQSLGKLFKKNFGEFTLNAMRVKEAKDLKFVDPDMPEQIILFYDIQVNIPSGDNVQELFFQHVEGSLDIGELKEDICQETDVDSNDIILKHRGLFLFPSDDGRTVQEVFGNELAAHVLQITAYSKAEAQRLGHLEVYQQQLVLNKRNNQTYIPAGAVEIPFMIEKPADAPQDSEAIQKFIEAQKTRVLVETKFNANVPPPPTAPKAPLPPSAASKAPAANFVESTCRMFHWEKVPQTEDSIWCSSEVSQGVQINSADLETLFTRKERPKAIRIVKAVVDSSFNLTPRAAVVTLNDSRQAQNMEIMLKQLPSIPDIVRGIEALDASILSRDVLELMFQNFPKEEDYTQVKSLDQKSLLRAQPSVLYVHALSKLDNWQTKLKAWKFTLDFAEREIEIMDALNAYQHMLISLRECNSLRTVLAFVLSCGNLMNSGTYRGSAVGFRLDSLLKLSSTKSTVKQSNLLDFIVYQIMLKSPQSLTFSQDIQRISKELGRKTLVATSNSLSDLLRDLRSNSIAVSQIKTHSAKNDSFARVVAFYTDADERVTTLTNRFEKVWINAKQIFGFFGLGISDAEKMFLELYPPDVYEQRKKDQIDAAMNTVWQLDSIAELEELMKVAFEARTSEKDLKLRQVLIKEASKKLFDWHKAMELDLEATRDSSNSKRDDISVVSELLQNLFRLLLEFSEHFSKSMGKLMNPPRRTRKVRRMPSTGENKQPVSSSSPPDMTRQLLGLESPKTGALRTSQDDQLILEELLSNAARIRERTALSPPGSPGGADWL